jgi:filamentous hemagglutinin family protein
LLYLLVPHYGVKRRKSDMLDRINSKWRWLSFLLPGILFPLRIALAAGGITTDGTVGPAQSLTGANVAIPQNLGTTVGKNLFHSFDRFNVNARQTVTFTENAPHALDNVISRVTGGSRSDINGTLRSTPSGHANLYLVNPSGIVFGQNARIDVAGAFHASTADEVRFQDGAKFSASQPSGSTLTAAAPASFGFLDTSGATNGLLKIDGAKELVVKERQKLDMVGRNIRVENGAMLSAPVGEVRLLAVGKGSMNIPLDQSSETAHGELALTGSTIDVSGKGGGKVIIRGSDLKMDQGAKITADTYSKQNGAGIDVRLTGDIAIKSGSLISASTFGSGDAGNIYVKAQNLLIDGRASLNGQNRYFPTGIGNNAYLLDRSNKITGNAGSITLDIANHLALTRGGQIGSYSYTDGGAGSITVKAGQLLIDGQGILKDNSGNGLNTSIFSQATEVWSGRSGNIAVIVQGDMTMKGGGTIDATTSGNHEAGNIHVTANNLLIDGQATLNGQKSYFPTYIVSNTVFPEGSDKTTGNAGNITLDIANRLSLTRGGEIGSGSFSVGDAGNVTIKAGELLIDRQGILKDDSGNDLNTGIFSKAGELLSGKGGNIVMIVQGDMTMKGGGTIDASTKGRGAAGNIHVKANNLLIDGQATLNGQKRYFSTRIDNQAVSDGPYGKTGDAGSITLDIANRLSLTRGGTIASNSFTEANAGNVTVKAGELLFDRQGILKDDSGSDLDTGIKNVASEAWSGKGGDISVTVRGDMVVKGGSIIDATTYGNRAAGNIHITANNLLIDGQTTFNGQIIYLPTEIVNNTAASEATKGKTTGDAGSVTLDIADRLALIRGGGIGSGTYTMGDAGSITVKAGQLLIDGQGVLADIFGNELGTSIFTNANQAFSGKGGDIAITVQGDMTMNGGGTIDASTASKQERGLAGNIFVTAKNLKLINGSRISAEALEDSGGKTGNLRITATDSIDLSNQSKISIENGGSAIDPQQIKAGNLSVSASAILLDNSQITTNSTQNISAGTIQVNSTNQLFLNHESYISTEANNGNGGSIDIQGGQLIQLINSGFRTNVKGRQNGNGGNINVTGNSLIMETGLIQANTTAPHASGGNITLNLKALIPSGETLIQGGDQPVDWQPYVFGLNVIQAAAPEGISGVIQSTAPQLDLSGVLANLGGPQFDTSAISQGYCALGTGSSLIRQGKGGLLPRSRDSVMY